MSLPNVELRVIIFVRRGPPTAMHHRCFLKCRNGYAGVVYAMVKERVSVTVPNGFQSRESHFREVAASG
jgi:hypothetical protein